MLLGVRGAGVFVPHSRLARKRGAAGTCRFDEIYRRFSPRLRRMALRRCGNPSLAEDVVQETFLRAYQYRKTFDRSRPVWPWLSSIASNVHVDLLARMRPRHESFDGNGDDESRQLPDPSADPTEECQARERQRAINEVLASLNDRHRRVLLLKDAAGWRREDIAGFEGISLEALKSVLKRARETFRLRYSVLADRRGLRVITWPLIGPIIRRMRSSRARVHLQPGVAPSLFSLSNAPLSKAVTALVAAGLLGAMSQSSAPTVHEPATPSQSVSAEVKVMDVSGAPTSPSPGGSLEAGLSTKSFAPDVPEGSVEASAGVDRVDTSITVNAKVASKVGPLAPYLRSAPEVYCDTETRRRVCDSVDLVPTVPEP